MVEFLIIAAMYGIVGYFMARAIFGPKWDEAPGWPVACGAIWPVLIFGALCVGLFGWELDDD